MPSASSNTSRNTVTPSNFTNAQSTNLSETSRNNVTSSRNNENTSTNTVNTPTNNSPPTVQAPLTITIPPHPPLHRSARIHALSERDHTLAFLAEYSTVRDTHDLFPTDLVIKGALPSIDYILAALTDGSLEPSPADDDEPTWAQAMASNEREYWIAGGRDELKSLQDLKVFVLVPCSNVPHGQRLLKGKLVCKKKQDNTGHVTRYKVQYVAKGFAQNFGIGYESTTKLLHLLSALNLSDPYYTSLPPLTWTSASSTSRPPS